MINLLPQREKKKILGAYRMRLGVIVLCIIFILELLAAVTLAPSYSALIGATNSLTVELAQQKQNVPTGGDDVQKQLAAIKTDIALLQPSADIVTASQLLGLILAQKPAGIGISSYSYNHSGDTTAAQFVGNATTREDLLAFQRDLKANPRFVDVKYAQSFITKKTDINFQLTVTYK